MALARLHSIFGKFFLANVLSNHTADPRVPQTLLRSAYCRATLEVPLHSTFNAQLHNILENVLWEQSLSSESF